MKLFLVLKKRNTSLSVCPSSGILTEKSWSKGTHVATEEPELGKVGRWKFDIIMFIRA